MQISSPYRCIITVLSTFRYRTALMTSCIDNPGKVAEYILSSRQMGISILPPDINRSEGKFTVDGQAIFGNTFERTGDGRYLAL